MEKTVTALKSGTVRAIPSKSDAHRKFICAALSENVCRIPSFELCDDLKLTLSGLRALGFEIAEKDGFFEFSGYNHKTAAEIFCGASGTTLRFLTALSAALGTETRFDGSERLRSRPIKELIAALRPGGAEISADTLPFTVCGKLQNTAYPVDCSVSSQYASALLIALTRTGGTVIPCGKTVSAPYIDMTVETLKDFGVKTEKKDDGITVPKSALTAPPQITLDGDYSNAAPFLCIGAISHPVTVCGLYENSVQGDKKIIDILRTFGADVTVSESDITVSPGRLCGVDISVKDTPDLFPVLAVTACFAESKSVFRDTITLKYKESDRVLSTKNLIEALGGKAETSENTFTVYPSKLKSGTVSSFDDHRIIMAAAVAGCASGGVKILGAEHTEKSYPNFFEEFICQ